MNIRPLDRMALEKVRLVTLQSPPSRKTKSAFVFASGAMGHQQLYWSHPRKFSQGSQSCDVCSNRHGLIHKYSLNMRCQCFRQYGKDISFIKLDHIIFMDLASVMILTISD